MYYKKLMDIYLNSPYYDDISPDLIKKLAFYIEEKIKIKNPILSPYEFLKENAISLDKSLLIFLCFSDKDGYFEAKYFFECFSPVCVSERIFLSDEMINSIEEIDDPILCDECGTEYLIEDIATFIKVYFILKPELLFVEDNKQHDNQKKDKNSTLQALRGLSKGLKCQSPSPLDKNDGEGEKYHVDLSIVDKVNNIGDRPVSQKFRDDSSKIVAFLRS